MVNKQQWHFLANKHVLFVPLFIFIRDGKIQSPLSDSFMILSSRGHSAEVSNDQEHENTGRQHPSDHDELVLSGSPLY